MTTLLSLLSFLSWTIPLIVIILAMIVSYKKEGNHARTEANMVIVCLIYYCALSLYTLGAPVQEMTELFYRSFHALVFTLFARALVDKLQFINQQRVRNASNNMVHNSVFSKKVDKGGDRKSSAAHR